MAHKNILDRVVDPIFDWGMRGGQFRRYASVFLFGLVVFALLAPGLLALYFLFAAQQADGMAFFTDWRLWAALSLIPVMVVIRLVLRF